MSREIDKPKFIDNSIEENEADLNRFVKYGEILSVVKDITDDIISLTIRIRESEITQSILIKKLESYLSKDDMDKVLADKITLVSIINQIHKSEVLDKQFVHSMIELAIASGVEESLAVSIINEEINYIIFD